MSNNDIDNTISKEDKNVKTANKVVTVSNYRELTKALNDNKDNKCTINLKKGTYNVIANTTVELSEKSDITINGNQSIILDYSNDIYKNVVNTERIFTDGKLTINNLTIKKCIDPLNGGLTSNIILNNCNITDNEGALGFILTEGEVKIITAISIITVVQVQSSLILMEQLK